MWQGRAPGDLPDRGSVTAELAVGMTVVVGLLGLAGGVIQVGQARLEVESVAAIGARMVARQESGERVAAAVSELAAPGGFSIRVESRSGVAMTTVRVWRDVRVAGFGRFRVSGSAIAAREVAG